MTHGLVSIHSVAAYYPDGPVFHPTERYPEYVLGSLGVGRNTAYVGVREALRLLGFDEEHYGTQEWNPFRKLITPGDHVLIKPNLIRASHAARMDEWEQIVTHPAIIRVVLDYVHIALKGKGQVTIADGPQTDSDYDEIVRRTHLDEIVTFFRDRGLDVSLLDLRRERWLQKGGVTYRRDHLPGDPLGYASVSLDGASEFSGYALNGRFYAADYDVQETATYHASGRHAYVLCRSAMDADVVINLPKMKTHKKTGVTLSLKNLVGINGCRNCLPHHTLGTPAEGGDEFPDSRRMNGIQSRAITSAKRCLSLMGGCGGPVSRLAFRCGRRAFGDTSEVVRSGNWYGNDTLWRTVLDLNKAFFYFDGQGRERRDPRRYLTIVDGIIAGEGDGPSCPDEKRAGLIVAGFNPVAVDTVCATLMGFDYEKIPLLKNAWSIERYPLVRFRPHEVSCRSNVAEWCGSVPDLQKATHLGFRPHFGWSGHIERG